MRSVFCLKATAVLAGMLVLSGCPGEKSDPQPQQAAPRVESTGLMTDGVALRKQTIVAKGAAGLTRMSSTESSGTFTLNMADLTGPYLFANTPSPTGDPGLVFLTSVSAKVGRTNVTPLTTLLTAQVLGVAPATAFDTFSTTLDKSRITEDELRAAQADLTAFLQDALGVQTKSGTSSLIDSPYEAEVGDPMYDTILALNEKIAANNTTLEDVAARVALGAQACLTEKIQISIDGQQKKFCPISKSSVPEEADTAILDYKFIDISSAVLLVKVRDDTVLRVDFATAASATYSCNGTACVGVSLGAKAEDESREIVFGGLALTGNGGGALVEGTFIGPPPSIELPILPCTDNRYFAILSDHSVIADCIRAEDPFQYGATIGGVVGHGTVGIDFPGQVTGRLKIVVDRVTHAPVYVYFRVSDPGTGVLRERFVCHAEACTGVTWGPATIDKSRGPTVELRTITLDNTTLIGVDADGNPTGESAVMKASGLGLFVPDDPDLPEEPEQPLPAYPVPADCAPATSDTVSAVGPGGEEFNLCMFTDPAWRGWFDMDGMGSVQVFFQNDTGDSVWVDLLPDGQIADVGAAVGSTGEVFTCRPPECSGVSVIAPSDPTGPYIVSFSNTVLRTSPPASEPPTQPRRALTLTSGDLVGPMYQ
jgi:hypothetical protein